MNDPDAGLTPYERTRQALHRAIDNITRAWPLALEDANARGYPPGNGYQARGNGATILVDSERVPVTSVEATALQPSQAVAWLAELADVQENLFRRDYGTYYVTNRETFKQHGHHHIEALLARWASHTEQTIRQIINLSNKASHWWPQTPTPGATINNVTIGKRGNTIETCGHCNQPVTGGHTDPIRRINGIAHHKSPCWYTVTTGLRLVRIIPKHPKQVA